MELALGAMASLAPKLGELLTAEYVVQKGLKPDIESLSMELVMMKASLEDSSRVPPEQLSEVEKLWARHVRELSYDMEDAVDDFNLCVASGKSAASNTDPNFFKNILGKVTTPVKKVKHRHQISDKIKDIKKLSNELAELRAKYTVKGPGSNLAARTGIDPRVLNLYKQESDLVGIKESRNKVIRMLCIGTEDGAHASNQDLKIVSIVGVGGLGKTTLAKTVHDMFKKQFGCFAFISVGRTPSLTRTFEKMLVELDNKMYKQVDMSRWDIEQFGDELHEFLKHKRYFIVVDDIWDAESWKAIRYALRGNKCGSKIIMTTRNSEVITKVEEKYELKHLSDENSKKLLYKRIQSQEGESHEGVSSELSSKIIGKCRGIPLAIIAIASLLVERPCEDWPEVCNSIDFGDGENTTAKIMSYSYYDLPSYLKPCILHLSKFPEDSILDTNSVIWMWIGEGFVDLEKQEGSLFEVGERYFKELVNRSMIQPMDDTYDRFTQHFRIHDIVFDVIRKLSAVENFITILDRKEQHGSPDSLVNVKKTCMPRLDCKVRRLAVRNHHVQCFPEDTMDKPEVLRSLNIEDSKIEIMARLHRFSVCRVLKLQNCHTSIKNLGRLLHLKYLDISYTAIDELPKELGHLKSLQTLVLVETGLDELPPAVCSLTQLLCLRAEGFKRFPAERMGSLTSLEELRLNTVVGRSATEDLVVELGKLTRMRMVTITFSEVLDESLQQGLVQSLCKLRKLQELALLSSSGLSEQGATVWEDWEAPRHLRRLLIQGITFSRLPVWINRSRLPFLCFLCLAVYGVEVQDLDNLAKLPELSCLELGGFSWPAGYTVGTEGFKNLRFCRLGTALKFRTGAMPKLEELRFVVYAGHWSWVQNGVPLEQFPTKDEIEDLDLCMYNLLSLEQVTFTVDCSGATASGVLEMEATVKRAVKNHPNRPTLQMDRKYVRSILSDERRVALLRHHIEEHFGVLDWKDEPGASFIRHLRSYRHVQKAVISINCAGASMCEVKKVEAAFRNAAELHRNYPTIQLIRTNTDEMVFSPDHPDREEYVVQKGLKPDIESLSRELVMMNAALIDESWLPPDQLSEVEKLWARQVRELSYEMGDAVDEFTMRMADGGKCAATSTDAKVIKKILGKATTAMKKFKDRRQISNIKKLSNELAEFRAMYTVRGVEADLAVSTRIDSRVLNLYKKESDLVGIEESRDKLIRMLRINVDAYAHASEQSLKIVSIVGVGGLGKTTLAKTVHDMLKKQFDCSFFISIGRTPSLTRTFEKMLVDLDEKYSQVDMSRWDEERFSNELHVFLRHKRYFIIVDDIWDKGSWDVIRYVLRDNNCGSRIIMTTRNFAAVTNVEEVYRLKPLSDGNSKKLFYKRIQSQKEESLDGVSSELSTKIIDKCGGIPLAIIAVASLLVEKPCEDWAKVYDSIGFGNGDNTLKILSYSYDDLPYYLKPCLLHLSIFPEDSILHTKSVIWMWIGEDFVHLKEQEGSLFEVGERYFNELVNRSMIQPMDDTYDGFTQYFRIHDIVLDLIRMLSSRENFISILDSGEQQYHSGSMVRRLVVQNHRVQRFSEDIVGMPEVLRSLIIVDSKFKNMTPLHRFRFCRVLCIQRSFVMISKHLGRLLHLEYLEISDMTVDELPKEIGHLKSLKTLLLKNIGLVELPPAVCLLTQLMCLVAIGFNSLPADRIGNLTLLEELQLKRVVGQSATEFMAVELGKLTRLRMVRITFSGVLDESLQKVLVQSLCNLRELRELILACTGLRQQGAAVWEHWEAPRQLRRLLIQGIIFSRLPGWINRSRLPHLCFLSLGMYTVENQDLDNLAKLPELSYLDLGGFSWPPGYTVGTDGFRNLRFCRVGTALKFHMGAMPRLEELQFRVNAGYWISSEENGMSLEQFPTKDVIKDLDLGLENLPSLEEVTVKIDCLGATATEVQEVEAIVTRAVVNHPNRPTIKMYRRFEEKVLSDESRVALLQHHIEEHFCVLKWKDKPDARFNSHLWIYRHLQKAVISIDCAGASMCEVEKVEEALRHAAETHPNHPTIQLIRTNTGQMVCSSDHPDTELDDKCHELPQLGSTAIVFSIGAGSEEHHDSKAHKRCARGKRAIGSARKPRPSTTRQADKERPNLQEPSASRVDFSGDNDHDGSLDNLLCKLHLGN